MKRFFPLFFAACLVAALSATALAQAGGPPKVLLFEREQIKPGKFDDHEREANSFARTLAHAQAAGEPVYVRFGLTPVAGNYNEVSYIYGFDSLERWAQSQRDIERWMTTPGPMKTFYDRAAGPAPAEDFHESVRSMVGVYQPSMSYNPRANLAKARYVTVSTFHVRPGHYGDWMRLVSMYVDAMKRVKGDPHFAGYEVVGGAPDGTFVFLSSMESMAELDAELSHSGEFPQAMGDKLGDFERLGAATIDSVETTIYAIDPRISNPPAAFVAADPAFWSQELPAAPQAAAATARAAARKRMR